MKPNIGIIIHSYWLIIIMPQNEQSTEIDERVWQAWIKKNEAKDRASLVGMPGRGCAMVGTHSIGAS